jgi:hypothetical protein
MTSKETNPPLPGEGGADRIIQVDPNPTPKEEAKDFENADERMQAKAQAHELAIINSKKGWVGRVTGSTNEALNTGVFILFLSLILLAASMVGSAYYPTTFAAITDNLFKLALTVAGYIFGTHQSSK